MVAEVQLMHPLMPQSQSQVRLEKPIKVPDAHVMQVVAEAHSKQLVIEQRAVQVLLTRVYPEAHDRQVETDEQLWQLEIVLRQEGKHEVESDDRRYVDAHC